MQILQALLAFAVTMLGLATIVTLLLEFASRVLKRRGRVMTHMLGLVFEKEIGPRIKATQTVVDAKKRFADMIRKSPLGTDIGSIPAWLRGLFAVDRSDEMTREEFVRRLARSEWGQQLRERAEAEIDAVVDRVVGRFDELSDATREYFKSSSAVISLGIGVLLALAANIDGYRVLDFYVEHPEVAEQVGSQADEFLNAQTSAQQKLDEALGALDQPPGEAAEAATDAARAAAAAKEHVAEARELIESTRTHLGQLAALGVPLGWTYFPHCLFVPGGISDKSPDPHCRPSAEGTRTAALAWFFATLVTGFLIGLGGPFWYDAVRGLMRVTQVLRGRAPTTPHATTTGADAGAARAAPSGAATAAATPSAIFKAHTDPAAG